MFYWAMVFLTVALISGFFGFAGVISVTLGIAQLLFYVFVVLFVLAVIVALLSRRR